MASFAKHIFNAALVAALISSAGPAWASCSLSEPPPPPAANAPTLQRSAFELAQLYYSNDSIMSVIERSARQGFEQGIREQPQGEMILREHPGMVDAGFGATMRVIRACAPRLVLALQHRAADVIARELSPAHIAGVTQFYRSDAGRALMASAIENMRIPQVRLRPDGTPEDMTVQDLRSSVPENLVASLSPAQMRSLADFSTSPHGMAFTALAPQLEQLTVTEMNRAQQEMMVDIQREVGAAIQDYVRTHSARRPAS